MAFTDVNAKEDGQVLLTDTQADCGADNVLFIQQDLAVAGSWPKVIDQGGSI